jgi:hypothetical protein
MALFAGHDISIHALFSPQPNAGGNSRRQDFAQDTIWCRIAGGANAVGRACPTTASDIMRSTAASATPASTPRPVRCDTTCDPTSRERLQAAGGNDDGSGEGGKPNEFGKMVKLQEAEDQLVIDYEVYDRRPSDSDLLIAAIETHRLINATPAETLSGASTTVQKYHSERFRTRMPPILLVAASELRSQIFGTEPRGSRRNNPPEHHCDPRAGAGRRGQATSRHPHPYRSGDAGRNLASKGKSLQRPASPFERSVTR